MVKTSKFNYQIWLDYYTRTHELSRTEFFEDKLIVDDMLKQCSKYLDSCGMKMPYLPKDMMSRSLEDGL